MGADCVMETLRNLTARKRDAVIQDDALSTKAPKISAADGALTLTESADDVFCVSLHSCECSACRNTNH